MKNSYTRIERKSRLLARLGIKMKHIMTRLLQTCRQHPLELGIILLFVFPPVGICLLLIAGWVALYKVLYKKERFYFTTGTLFFLCLFVASTAATIQTPDGKHMVAPLLILGYLGLYLRSRRSRKVTSFHNFKWLTIFGGLYISIVGQLQLYGNLFFSKHQWLGMLTGSLLLGYDQPDRLFGSAYNPNFASFLLLLGLAFLLAEGLEHLREGVGLNRKAIFVGGSVLLVAAAIFQTGSRTGVAAMTVLVLLACFRYYWKTGMLLLLSLTAFSYKLVDLLPRTNDLGESVGTRKTIWETSVAIWKMHPYFGVTPLGFKDAYARLSPGGITHAHNIFLGFFSEYGTLGGLAFLLLVVVGFYKGLTLLVRFKNNKRFVDSFLFSLPVILLTGMFDHPLVSPQTALLAVILIGNWDGYTSRLKLFAKFTVSMKQVGGIKINAIFHTQRTK